MKNRLVCILSCLMLINPFAFGIAAWRLTPNPYSPSPSPTPRQTSINTIRPSVINTPTMEPNVFRSNARIQKIEREWDRFFKTGQKNGASGLGYYRIMKNRFVYRETMADQEIPRHIKKNFHRFVALYDLDPTANDKCGALWENNEREGNQCYYEHYNGYHHNDEL
jgi:hypothetical protein